jgi:hypothetical protein
MVPNYIPTEQEFLSLVIEEDVLPSVPKHVLTSTIAALKALADTCTTDRLRRRVLAEMYLYEYFLDEARVGLEFVVNDPRCYQELLNEDGLDAIEDVPVIDIELSEIVNGQADGVQEVDDEVESVERISLSNDEQTQGRDGWIPPRPYDAFTTHKFAHVGDAVCIDVFDFDIGQSVINSRRESQFEAVHT